MINCRSAETVAVDGVLFGKQETVQALAVGMVRAIAESNVGMVCDCPGYYTTKAEVETVFRDLNGQALDLLGDHIETLRRALEKVLSETKFSGQVRRMDFDSNGQLEDVSVDIIVG